MESRKADKALPTGWTRKEFHAVLRYDANEDWKKGKERNTRKKDHPESKF